MINQRNNSFKLASEFKILNENGFKINLFKIDKSLTEKLTILAKEKNIKLTSFINTAIFYALRNLYVENNIKFPTDLTCGLPANLRLRYKPNLDFSHIRYQVCLTRFNLTFPYFGEFKSIWDDSKYIDYLIEKSTSIDEG